MNSEMKRRLEAFERADQFLADHPIPPAIARAIALTAQLKAIIDEMKTHRNDQDHGAVQASSGTDGRAFTAERLRRLMRRIAKISKQFDPAQLPGVRQTLRVPSGTSYHALEARAETFLTTIEPLKDEFVAWGLPAGFVEELRALLADLTVAAQCQRTGRAQHVRGTAGLDSASRNGLACVRGLDAILFTVYEDDPALYAAWKSASRVQRAPQRTTANPPPPVNNSETHSSSKSTMTETSLPTPPKNFQPEAEHSPGASTLLGPSLARRVRAIPCALQAPTGVWT